MNPKVIPINNYHQECRLIKALIKGISQNTVIIDTEEGVVNAQIAFSCVVSPMVGDTVLVNQAEGEFHILSILKREAEQDMALNYPANVKITACSGQIDIISQKNINLSSVSDTQIISRGLKISSAEMLLNTGKLNACIPEIESHSLTIKLYTQILNTVAKQIIQKSDILIRWVEGVETLNVGNLIQKVRNNYTSHANHAVITAKKDMRIDGERIHMG